MQIKTVMSSVIMICILSACGQTGPLYLPKDSTVTASPTVQQMQTTSTQTS